MYRDVYREARYGTKRKSRIKNLLLYLLLLCIITLTLALGSHIFAIEEIKISGNETIPSEDIRDIVKVYLGKNLLRVKGEALSDLLMETLPLKEVKVSYKLPDTLIIKVKERQIAAAIGSSEGFVLVDDSGVVVAVQQKINQLSVPILTGIEIREARIAHPPILDKDNIPYDQLMELMSLLKYMASELSEVNIEYLEGVEAKYTLYTLDGYQIDLGKFDKVKIAQIKEVLDDVRQNIREKGILDFNFSSPVFKTFHNSSFIN